MKRRIVASNESYSSEEGIENNLIEELNEDENQFVSPRKRLRSNAQTEEKSKDSFISDEEILYDDEDVDLSSVLSGKFKPDPFGVRSSRRLSEDDEEDEPPERPQRRSRRTRKFESHLQDYESNALPEKLDAKNSRAARGSEQKSNEYESQNELSDQENESEPQGEEYGELSGSESDASFVPKNEVDTKVSDDEMNVESELQDEGQPDASEQSDFDDLTPVQKPRSRKYATRSSRKVEEDEELSAINDEQDDDLDNISVSDEEVRPAGRRRVGPRKRKRAVFSDSEGQGEDEEPVYTRRRGKKPRIIDEGLSQPESDGVADEDEDDTGAPQSVEEKGSVHERGLSDEDSIELQSEADEDNQYIDDDEFENAVPGDWRDFMDLLRKIEAMVEDLQSKGQTKRRRVVNGQYSGALEQLLYFTDHTNDMGQMFNSKVSHTTFLQRIARTWTLFLKEIGLRLEQNQIDSILRTFVRCHSRPYLKIASAMWKCVFTKKERVYPLTHDELLDLCSPKVKLTVERQVQYLWLAKRLRNHDCDFESLMLCCAMGEFYKNRYPKKRTAQITEWEDELHQRFVTHMLTLAASPLRNINEMSLFNEAGWKYVSIVAGNPMAYMNLQLSEGVKRDFVSRFVLYYVLMYTQTEHFRRIKDKCEKLRRTIRTNFPFETAFDCISNPSLGVFVRLADSGCTWLQNIVLDRLLLFTTRVESTLTLFQTLVYKGLWDIAISSIINAPPNKKGLCQMMTNGIPSIVPLPKSARYMFIEVIEKRIRCKEKLTSSTRTGIETIGEISMSMKIYLTAIGNAYDMQGHLKKILPSPTDLRLLRYDLVSIKNERDWTLIMTHVEDRCKTMEQRHEYFALRKEEPFINTDANWIDKIFARSDVAALDLED
eukprot:TRINITY_DN5593_c0_g1_i1.p1 TRINITY_DN5593_c0_g1~~TRINITY_DN5593_c0_g1_i1.p1  ORF type:complete len:886 (-),score=94.65 TRINITY_DN5593_c0_g1_i1:680-3337(-)